MPRPFDKFAFSGDQTGSQIAVSAEIFRRTVNYQINSELRRSLIKRCGKRVINRRDDIFRLRDFDDRFDVA